MPDEEGLALHRAGLEAASAGPLLEIGSYCGKSAVYLGAAARAAGTVLFTVDHHRGSEENQAGWEHHDPTLVDPATGRMDTLPASGARSSGAGLEDTVIAVVGDVADRRRATGARRSGWCSSTAATAPSPRTPTTRAGRRSWRPADCSPSTTCSPTRPTAAARRSRSTRRALASGAFVERDRAGRRARYGCCGGSPTVSDTSIAHRRRSIGSSVSNGTGRPSPRNRPEVGRSPQSASSASTMVGGRCTSCARRRGSASARGSTMPVQ